MLYHKLSNKNNSDGLTRMEIVTIIGILAIMAVIAITLILRQFEITRETADMANIRTQYARMMVSVNSGDYDEVQDRDEYVVKPLVQEQNGWQGRFNVPITEDNKPYALGSAFLYYSTADDAAHIKYSDTYGHPSKEEFEDFKLHNAYSYPTKDALANAEDEKTFALGSLLYYGSSYYAVIAEDGVTIKGSYVDDNADDNLYPGAKEFDGQLVFVTDAIYNSEQFSKIKEPHDGDVVFDGKDYYIYSSEYDKDNADSGHLLKLNRR